MEHLTIGKVAQESGYGVETLRFYERRGLIEPDARTVANYRLYRPSVLRRLRFIRRAQTLGFSLDEIVELLELSVKPAESAGEVKSLTEAKIADIDQRIRDLERMRDALVELDARCPGHHGTTADCPILAALSHDQPLQVSGRRPSRARGGVS